MLVFLVVEDFGDLGLLFRLVVLWVVLWLDDRVGDAAVVLGVVGATAGAFAVGTDVAAGAEDEPPAGVWARAPGVRAVAAANAPSAIAHIKAFMVELR